MMNLQSFFLSACLFLISSSVLAEQDFVEASIQAQYSNDTYLSEEEISRALHTQGQTLIRQATMPAVEVSYFLSEAQGIQTIAIRGTANLENALLDLNIELQTDDLLNIKLHQGFASAAKAIHDDVLPYLNKGKPIHLTGHSLGGAAAVVLGMYLTQEHYDVAQIITFGQPKVTNVTGAEVFEDLPLVRFVTPHDIVPLVPPISPLQIKDLDIYWHMGIEVILMDDNEYAETSGVKSALRATKFTTSIPSEKNLHAHMMTNYMELVEALKETSKEVPYQMEISLFGFTVN